MPMFTPPRFQNPAWQWRSRRPGMAPSAVASVAHNVERQGRQRLAPRLSEALAAPNGGLPDTTSRTVTLPPPGTPPPMPRPEAMGARALPPIGPTSAPFPGISQILMAGLEGRGFDPGLAEAVRKIIIGRKPGGLSAALAAPDPSAFGGPDFGNFVG